MELIQKSFNGADEQLFSRIAAIHFLNSQPLIYPIRTKIRKGTPSDIAKWLRSGEIDAGLVSIVEILFTGRYQVLNGWGIISNGEVESVVLFHKEPLHKIKKIFCDKASLTSIVLLRIIMNEMGYNPTLAPLSDSQLAKLDAVLLIGDRAIAARNLANEYMIFDLGKAWKELTGLPFVYALWALRKVDQIEKIAYLLDRAARYGVANIDMVIANTNVFTYQYRAHYLKEVLRYYLDDMAYAGIECFTNFLRKYRKWQVYEIQFFDLNHIP